MDVWANGMNDFLVYVYVHPARKSKDVGDEAGESWRPDLHDFTVMRKIGIPHCRQELQFCGGIGIISVNIFSSSLKDGALSHSPPLPSVTSSPLTQAASSVTALLIICGIGYVLIVSQPSRSNLSLFYIAYVF